MFCYKHTVQYHETDRMGVTHHSNYIKWMEESRIAFMKAHGWDYRAMEENGIFIPVVSVACRYLKTTTFEDEINVQLSVKAYNGVRLTISYSMALSDGTQVCEAESVHCFLDGDGKILRMKRLMPSMDASLREMAASSEE